MGKLFSTMKFPSRRREKKRFEIRYVLSISPTNCFKLFRITSFSPRVQKFSIFEVGDTGLPSYDSLRTYNFLCPSRFQRLFSGLADTVPGCFPFPAEFSRFWRGGATMSSTFFKPWIISKIPIISALYSLILQRPRQPAIIKSWRQPANLNEFFILIFLSFASSSPVCHQDPYMPNHRSN